ncbi:MAG: hypothetical protein NC394_02805 [Bacteroides sp.]|nr:hypothetical protein [Bacteroides sp.]
MICFLHKIPRGDFMQAVWFFLSVFFGIIGGYFVVKATLSALTGIASDRYSKRRGKGYQKKNGISANGRNRTGNA